MDPDTIGRYLDRIGALRPSAMDATALRELQRRHLEAVPFENLSIHLGEGIVLAEDALVDKIVGRGRGGFCYELNGLFAALLDGLGFDVSLHAASMFRDDGHAVYPLRRDWPEAQEDPAGSFLVLDAGGGDVDVVMDGKPRYRAEARARRIADFVRPCWWHATSPESHFHDIARCSRATETGRVSIIGDRLVETVDGERTETPLRSDAEVLAAYEKHFGIQLPRVPTC